MSEIDPNDAASAALGGGAQPAPAKNPNIPEKDDQEAIKPAKAASKPRESNVKGSGQTALVVGVIIAVVVLGVVAVMMLTRESEKRTLETPTVSSFGGVDSTQKGTINNWMTVTGEEVNELKTRTINLEGKMDDILRANQQMRDDVKTALEATVEAVRKAQAAAGTSGGGPQARVGPGASQIAVPTLATPEQARIQATLKTYEDDLINLSTDPKVLRQAVAGRLRALGVQEEEIKNLVAATAQKAGRYYIGDVKEEFETVEQVEKMIPIRLAKLYPDVIQFMQALGADEGKLMPAMAFEDVKRFVKARLAFTPDEAELTKDDMIKKLCVLARIRRENLEDLEMDYIPFLITKRDRMQVPKDRIELSKYVFMQKEHLPETMTAGKLLTFVHILMREINNVEEPETKMKAGLPETGQENMRPLDAATATRAITVTRQAVRNAYNMGKREQGDLSDTGMRALKQFLEAARVESSDEQRSRIVLQAINGLMEELRAVPEQQPPPTESPARPARPLQPGRPTGMQDQPGEENGRGGQVRAPIEEFGIVFGPLVLKQQTIINGLLWMAPQMLGVIGVDAGTQEGSALLVGANEQSRRFVDDLIQGGGLRDSNDIRTALMPALIQVMRSMQPLAGIDLKLSQDPLLNDSRVGRAMRGAILGSIYGPFLQDEEKAKAVASEALPRVERQLMLTPELHAKLNAIPGDRPLELSLASLLAYAPGRIAYGASRFQDVSSMVAERIASAPTYMGAIAPLFKDDKDDTLGRLSEQMRVFVPMSVAVRDDGRMPVAELSKMVDQDILAFTGIYAAEYLVSMKVLRDIIPTYAMSVSDEYGGPSHLIKVASTEVPINIASIVRERRVAMLSDNLMSTSEALAAEVVPRVERILVREVVLSRVVPRLTRSGTLAGAAAVKDAIESVSKRADSIVEAPFTPNRIDEWASSLTREGRDILAGSASETSVAPRLQPPGPTSGPNTTSLGWPAKRIETSAGGKGALVGIVNGVVRLHKITIPAASYANAHILSGIDAEFGGGGGGTNNETVLLNMPYSWRGPNGSTLVMRNLRLIGKATAKPGPERVMIEISALSYVFNSGRSIYVPADGYVVDPIEGKAGAPGVWNWNLSKVMPLAMASGAGKGMSEALLSNTQTEVVSALGTTSTVNSSNADKMEQALLGGLSGATNILTGYVEQVLKDVHPSIGVGNGAVVGIVLNTPVEFDVPEEEFMSLQTDSTSFDGM